MKKKLASARSQRSFSGITLCSPMEDAEAFLSMEREASAAYWAFVGGDCALIRRVQSLIWEVGCAEFGPPYGQLVRDEVGNAVGMFACLGRRDLLRRRAAGAMTLARAGILASNGAEVRRLGRAGAAMIALRDDDLYLSRIAVAESARGCGVGSVLMSKVFLAAQQSGANRIVLEVARQAATAIRLYSRHGFRVLDEVTVLDNDSNRSLTYVHMGCSLF